MLKTEASEDEEEDTEEEELEPAEPPTTQLQAVVPPAIETVLAPQRIRKIDFVGRRNWYFAFSLLIIIPGIFFMIDFVGRRNWYFAFSLLIIIPGIFFMAHSGFKLGIDFAGGTEFTVNFLNQPSQAQVEAAVASENAGGTVISTGGGGYIIRTLPLTPALQKGFEDDLTKKVGIYELQQVLEVGGTIAGETIRLALFSVFLAAIVILGLLTFWFRNVPGGWRAGFQFGGSALAALLHDVFLLTGVFSILGTGLNLRIGEINSLFVTAVLTVVNISIMQTLVRSIITSFTVVLVLVAILVSGGDTLKGFALALLIGIVSGTYSSIFNAAPLLVVWRRLQPLR